MNALYNYRDHDILSSTYGSAGQQHAHHQQTRDAQAANEAAAAADLKHHQSSISTPKSPHLAGPDPETISNNQIIPNQIQKLAHPIAEIRERALTTIITKIEHGFLSPVSDLLNQRELFSNLIESWYMQKTSSSDPNAAKATTNAEALTSDSNQSQINKATEFLELLLQIFHDQQDSNSEQGLYQVLANTGAVSAFTVRLKIRWMKNCRARPPKKPL